MPVLRTEDPSLALPGGFRPRFTSECGKISEANLLDVARQLSSLSFDYHAINTFFRFGCFLNGRTPFKEIRREAPPPEIVSPVEISRADAIDAYIELFSQAVRRRIKPGTVIALTGGRDSRHIQLELWRQGRVPAEAYTLGVPERPTESTLAQLVARETGCRHTIITRDPWRMVQDEIQKDYLTSFMALDHAWAIPLVEALKSRPVWDGIGGGVLSAGAFLEDWNLDLYENGGRDELTERLVHSTAVPFDSDQTLFPRINVLEDVRAELDKHSDAANPIGSLYFWNRTRTVIAAYTWGICDDSITPYLDPDLWRFLASLPARMLIDHHFHTDAISTAYPEFDHIPYWEKEPGLRYRRSDQTIRNLIFARWAGKRLQWMNVLRAARNIVHKKRGAEIHRVFAEACWCDTVKEVQKTRFEQRGV